MRTRGLLSRCVLSVAGVMLVHTGATANSVTTSGFAIVFDASAASPDPDSPQPCSDTSSCTTTATAHGPSTNATITSAQASINTQPIPPGTILDLLVLPNGRPSLDTPLISINGSVNANHNANVATTAELSATASYTQQLSSTLLSFGAAAQDFPLNGTMVWRDTFFLQASNPLAIAFNWTVADSTINFSTGGSMTLSCNGMTSCTPNVNASPNVQFLGLTNVPTNGPPEVRGTILVSLDLAGLSTASLALSESVNLQTSASGTVADQSNIFHFNDPLTLTYFDQSGNIVPNLVLYDSSLNAVLPLSGQDFSGGSETPLPATLPLFATGIGGLALLGWRRKRKARA